MMRGSCRITITLRIMTAALPIMALLIMSQPALAAPVITLSPTSGAVGTRVTITGSNFQSYSGDTISIFFDDTEIDNSPLTVPESGNFSLDFLVPADAQPGRHEVIISSALVPKLVSHLFTVPETEIMLDVTEGTTGTVVNITGAGFYSGRLVTLHYYNRVMERVGTVMASPIGEFSFTLTIPNSTAGKHRITAANAEGNSAEADFEVTPWITINLTSGAVGDLLTVSGTGFSHNSAVSIQFGSREVARPKSDEFGSFEVTFNIPDLKPATYDIRAIDEDNNIHRVKFTITAGASLSPTMGAVGSRLTVTGSGFKPNEMITISYDAESVAKATTDNNGTFTGTFTVPISPRGSHLITITDGTTTKQLTFTVESVPPPVPQPLLPVNMSETKSEAYLDWERVTDPSQPVTYCLQIAADQNFSTIVVEKRGLTDSEYTLTGAEKLVTVGKDSRYYWRVKARDSATNESEWSAPWSFYIAAPPTPALLLPETDTRPEAKQIHFDWEDVTSLNPPVTYTLQVAADPNFTNIILEKKGLLKSEYTPTEEEELAAIRQEAPYYWRVKVIDGATNESEWSTPQPFYVGFSFTPPGWLLYTLIGLGVILIGLLAFWLGRRTAYYPPE